MFKKNEITTTLITCKWKSKWVDGFPCYNPECKRKHNFLVKAVDKAANMQVDYKYCPLCGKQIERVI